MNNAQLTAVLTKIMQIPGMVLSADSGIQVEASPARDLTRTHLRFTSDRGVNDNANGNTFVKYMREQGVVTEQRHPKQVIVSNSVLLSHFG